jgi:hypothetical protein
MPGPDASARHGNRLEATQQKLQEAQFFLGHMEAESRRASHDERRHDPKTGFFAQTPEKVYSRDDTRGTSSGVTATGQC